MKPDTIYKCPCCEFESEMEAQDKQFEHARSTGKKTGLWFFYCCPNCEITFTTAQSDKLSMKRWDEDSH